MALLHRPKPTGSKGQSARLSCLTGARLELTLKKGGKRQAYKKKLTDIRMESYLLKVIYMIISLTWLIRTVSCFEKTISYAIEMYYDECK